MMGWAGPNLNCVQISRVRPVTPLPSTTGFDAIRRELGEFAWRPELSVDEIPSPQRIAPHSAAIEAIIETSVGDDVGSGRLILLHDPAGNPAWDGTFRCVSYARADVDIDMVTDPLLADVGWTWLTDALNSQSASFRAESGTVTAASSRSFGGLNTEPDHAEVEIRASWTPQLDERGISPHLASWQELLCTTAGLPPVGEGIIPISFSLDRP